MMGKLSAKLRQLFNTSITHLPTSIIPQNNLVIIFTLGSVIRHIGVASQRALFKI